MKSTSNTRHTKNDGVGPKDIPVAISSKYDITHNDLHNSLMHDPHADKTIPTALKSYLQSQVIKQKRNNGIFD